MLKMPGRRRSPKVPVDESAYTPEFLSPETGLPGPGLFMDLVQRDIERSLRSGG